MRSRGKQGQVEGRRRKGEQSENGVVFTSITVITVRKI